MSNSIEVVIKAANGSVADFKISAQPSWTVTQVKNHIYRHYPTHPPLTSQRLIYSGRMLLDQQTLFEALPDLNNIIQPVIIHLVAYERSASAPAISQSSSSSSSSSSRTTPTLRSRTQHASGGSRQRNLSPVQEAADRGGGERGGVAPPVDNGRTQQPQGMPAQGGHNPWLRHRGGGGPYQFHPQNAPGQIVMPMAGAFPPQMAGGFQPQMAGGFQPQMAGGFPGQFYHPFGGPYHNQQAAQYWNTYYNQHGREPEAAGQGITGEGGEVVEDLDLHNLQELANNQDAEDQDVPMNAGGLGMMAGGGVAQFRRHRDVVDYVYMMTMMSFLALIAYVTGSLGRLMVFAGGIAFMILNQRGWFSLQRRRPGIQQREEMNPLERVGQQQGQNGEGRREHEEAAQENTEGLDESQQRRRETDGGETEDPRSTSENSQPSQTSTQRQGSEEEPREREGEEDLAVGEGREGTPPSPRPLAEEQPARPGLLMTMFVFVTSFFTSLVPQQRPELQFN